MEKKENQIENSLKDSIIKESLCLPGPKEITEEENKNKKKSGINELTLTLIILGVIFIFLVIIIFFVIEQKHETADRKKSLRSLRLISDRGIKVNSNINEKILKNLQKSGIIRNPNKYEERHVFGGIILRKKVKDKKIKKINI